MSWIHHSRRVRLGTVAIATICLFNVSPADAATPAEEARFLLEQSGITGGFVVHLGCGNGEATVACLPTTAPSARAIVRRRAEVAEARERLTEQGSYGPVAVDTFDSRTLPAIDNLVNLVVVDGESVALGRVAPSTHAQRVAMIRDGDQWSKLTKPWPEIDDWTHYLYDSKGNAVAHDQQAGPPRHLRWLGGRWSRYHDRMASMSALVSARGESSTSWTKARAFRFNCRHAGHCSLATRSAARFWHQPIPEWQNHLWPLKSGPTQLARRLVAAVDDRVFVTLGFHAPSP
ncbi:MAG: hypothetical protein R3C99_24960 [Pirellulaceae bacterium]